MDSVTYYTKSADTSERRSEVRKKRKELDDERSTLRQKQRDLATDSTEHEDCEVRIGVIDVELTELDEEQRQIDADRDELTLAKLEGFDYVRPRLALNRFLPAIPKGTKELDDSVFKSKPASSHWKPSLLAVGIILLIATILSVIMPSIVTVGVMTLFGWSTAQAISVVHMAIYFLVCSVVLGLQLASPPTFNDMVIANVSRYVLGAEHWSWSEQLRSCLVYSLASPLALAAPILFIPTRFIMMYFVMRMYLQKSYASSQSPAIAAASVVLQQIVRILISAVCVLGLVCVAILLVL